MDTNFGNLAGGALGLVGTIVVADIMIGGMRRLSGDIVRETSTHYHVRLHHGGHVPGRKRKAKAGEVVRVKKHLVKPGGSLL